jgi:AbrB family looped-hinge helix DNA binding protein
MPLTRKTRVSGSSIVVTIPSQLAEAFDINKGEEIEIVPLKDGEIIIRKANNGSSRGGTV